VFVPVVTVFEVQLGGAVVQEFTSGLETPYVEKVFALPVEVVPVKRLKYEVKSTSKIG
jgi:hypothetical protein